MSIGLIQFVLRGSQDSYILSDVEFSYFKSVYLRHTNFAIETKIQPIDQARFNKKITTRINKTGDLVSNMYLCIELNKVNPDDAYFAWVKRLGHAIIRSVSVTIGGVEYDKQFGTWLDIWWELSRQGDHEVAYSKMIGNIPSMTNYDNCIKNEYTLYIPLQFWFNRNYGLSLPLISINYNELYITVDFAEAEILAVRSKNFDMNKLKINNAYFLTNYIFLDTYERNKFVVTGHEYLIEQVQSNGGAQIINDDFMTFGLGDIRFSIKELYWCVKNGNYTSGKSFIYYANYLNTDIMDKYYNKYADAGKFKKFNLIEASKLIVLKSVSINYKPDNEGLWYEVGANTNKLVENFYVINKSKFVTYVNPNSLSYKLNNLTKKINATIIITSKQKIKIENITTNITIQDISIPVEFMTDTRVDDSLDVIVYQHNNYGLLINGEIPCIESARILFNNIERVQRFSNVFYNYIQPIDHHSNVPKNGINCYSFALNPEANQPSGSANFSRLDRADLQVWFNTYEYCGFRFLDYYCNDNLFYIYALDNNIIRIMSGFCNICFSS